MSFRRYNLKWLFIAGISFLGLSLSQITGAWPDEETMKAINRPINWVFEDESVRQTFEKRGSVTTGLFIEFPKGKLPSAEEEARILKIMDSAGLKRRFTIIPEVWDFEWPYIRSAKQATAVCEQLPENINRLLRYCYSNTIMFPERQVW